MTTTNLSWKKKHNFSNLSLFLSLLLEGCSFVQHEHLMAFLVTNKLVVGFFIVVNIASLFSSHQSLDRL